MYSYLLLPALLLYAAILPAVAPAGNALLNHPSPYLAMHGRDPVQWNAWNADVLARARREGRLVFVSVGYFSCHWCHVMQQESYQDEKIAGLINANFIPVKVDRELQPALDEHLIEFVRKLRGNAGWPLNVFLTPEGYPLVGVTYLPPMEFGAFLQRLIRRWEGSRQELSTLAEQVSERMEREADISVGRVDAGMVEQIAARFRTQALQIGDELGGGFGRVQKFPMAPQLATLLAELERGEDESVRSFLHTTLDNMSRQGLRDQLGGGFFRYVTDPGWQVPHFEKMLYSNALLASLYIDAARILEEPAWEQVARNTLDFMLSELRSEQGGYIASLSAVDEQAVEGGYYLWDSEELDRLLDASERRLVAEVWGMEGPPIMEAGYLPVQSQEAGRQAGKLAVVRDKLLEQRRQRGLPRDTKLLASWNGLALSSLARGAALSGGQRYAAAAGELRDFLVNRLWRDGELLRAVHAGPAAGGQKLGNAGLEDYAYVSRGLLDWALAVGREEDLSLIRILLQQAWSRFHDARGWRLDEDILIPLGGREPLLTDGALPSASAVLIDTSLRMARRTGDRELRSKALDALYVQTQALTDEPFYHASHLQILRREPPRGEADH